MYCYLCNRGSSDERCEKCYAQYSNDVATGHIPPQFIAAGEDLTWRDWYDIHEAGKRAANLPRATPESIKKATDETVRFCLARHRREREEKAARTQPQQARREAEFHARKLAEFYPY